MPGEKHNFMLMKKTSTGFVAHSSGSVFSNRQPRGAALKAATRGPRTGGNIYLRRAGEKRIHHFKGGWGMTAAPPAWTEARGIKKVKKSYVKKVGIIQ